MSTKLLELHSAIQKRQTYQVQVILETVYKDDNKFNINDDTVDGISCLQLALNLNDVQSFCLLIEHGASFDTLNRNDLQGSSSISATFLSHLPQVILAAFFIHAIIQCDVQLMELIINENSNICNHIDIMGLTPLHHMTITPPSLNREQVLAGVQLLLTHGAKIEKVSCTDLATPLHYACRHGKIEIVDLLLKECLDSSSLLLSQDSLGRTPTHLALYEGHWELVNGLIESFKEILQRTNYTVDYNGYTVAGLLFNIRLSSSLPNDYQVIMPVLSQVEANWCLHDGVSRNDIALVDHALSQGADPNVFDFSNQNPLLLACKLGDTYICSHLLEGGADHTLSDESGMTPLHYACNNGHELIVKTLLERVKEDDPTDLIESMSINGSTPLLLALNNCHQEIVTFLLSAVSHQKRESILWMKYLVASAQLNNLFIVKSIIDIYAPLKWAQELCNWMNASTLQINYKETKKRNFLKICVPMKCSPRLFLKDILKPKLARKKLLEHQQVFADNDCKQFTCINDQEHRPESYPQPFRLPATTRLSCSPISAMIHANNWNSLTFLIKEMKRTNCFLKYLRSDSQGISLLAKALSNGHLSNDYKQDILTVLKEMFPLPQDVSIGWALIHLLTVLLSPKPAIKETPLKTWPELLVSSYFSQYTTTVKYTEAISINDAVKLTSAILTREEEIPVLKPMSNICSLVFMTIVNQVSVKFLRVLLEKGTYTSDTCLCDNDTPYWCDTRGKCRRPRFSLIEALTHNLHEHARLLLEFIGLQDILPSPPTTSSSPKTPSPTFSSSRLSPWKRTHDESDDDESEEEEKEERENDSEDMKIFFFSNLIHGIRCLASDETFDLVLNIIQQFPQYNLNQFLLNSTSVVIWSLSLSSSKGKSLAEFLLDSYVKLVSDYCCEIDFRDFDRDFDTLERKIIPKIFTHIIERHSNCFKLDSRFNLFLTLRPRWLRLPCLLDLCGRGYTDLVKLVLKGREKEIAHKKDEHGYTPIYLAACGGHLDILEYLIKMGGPLLDAQYYGHYHPLLGVLMYFNQVYSHNNGYRNCVRLKLDSKIFLSPSLSCSFVFEDPSLAQRLVDLVLSDSKQVLAEPLTYLKALINIHQHDLRPFVKLIPIFPTLILSHLTVEDTEIIIKNKRKMFISDYALSIARHYNAHSSPELSLKFLSDIVSFVSPANILMAAKLCYWKLIPLCLPSNRDIASEIVTCKWDDILAYAVRNNQTDVVEYIVGKLREREVSDRDTLRKVMLSLCKGGPVWCNILNDLLNLSLTDDMILDGLLVAVRKGNYTALKILYNHRKVVLYNNLTKILETAAKNGREEIVTFLSTHHQYLSDIYNTELSFWLIVLEESASGGQKEMSHFAIDKILLNYESKLMTWDGLPYIINSCCWWGLDTVLKSLPINNNSDIYLTCTNGTTPFESACCNGHFSTLSYLPSFPQLDSVDTIRRINQKIYSEFFYDDDCDIPNLLDILNTGWWKETMKLSQFLQQENESNSLRLSPLVHDVKISEGFLPALNNNVQVVIEAHLNIWGNAAGIILQAHYSHKNDIIKSAVLSRSPVLVDTILRPLFDDIKDNPPVHVITSGSIIEALIQNDISILDSLSKYTNIGDITMPLYGYNILHLLAIYGRSMEFYEFIISSVSDDSLLIEKDHSQLTPVECALSNGNYPIGAKLLGLMKKRRLTIPYKSVEELCFNARGWFPKLMALNEKSPLLNKELLPIKGTSLREAKSLKDYCTSIQRVNERVSDVLLESSLGVFGE